MFGRGKSSLSKPKKVHSLENLKYLHSVLQKNRAVNEQNYGILVEALRLIAEILIWGDQNDSSVMDFFLEKNILEYFLQYMKQDLSRRICVQLLQTLNILFENITNQTAIYYLLSNNHTNAIITHRFDFTDEEVMAYYISFLKILSFRLNVNTISFFYIESRREFNLYVEAIKLFAHPEGMVRIAVRTITLNVHKVKDEAALEFIHHQTSLIYFSHLVWSIGNTILDIDCHKCQTKLKDLVAEHIDHLHYIDDLLSLGIEGLNEVLCDQLLRRLFIPLHIYSLLKQYKSDATTNLGTVRRPRLSYSVTVFTLIHVYLFLRDTRLICLLTEAILIGDLTLPGLIIPCNIPCSNSQIVFNDPTTQDCSVSFQRNLNYEETDDTASDDDPAMIIAKTLIAATVSLRASDQASPGQRLTTYLIHSVTSKNPLIFSQPSESLEHGLTQAKGVTPTLMSVLWPPNVAPLKLVEKNTETYVQSSISSNPCEKHSSDLSPGDSQIQSPNSCKDSYASIEKSPVKIEDSSSNSSVVFEQNDKTIDADLSNLSGRVFLRSLFRSLEIRSGSDQDAIFSILLLFAIKSNKVSETLIGCTVECSGIHEKRFIVSCGQQLVLVKPDSKQLGWGVITFIGPLQDLESHCDPADSRCLHVTIHAPGHLTCQNSSPGRLFSNINNTDSKSPIMVAKFLFEDHIRCMTARQLLSRGKTVVEQTKLRKIASLLDFPPQFIREKFLANNTSTGYNNAIVGSKNYMCNNQHTMIVNNRFDPANTRGMHLNSSSSSVKRISTNVITGTKRAEQSPPVQIRKFINDNDNNNTNKDSSGKTGESVRPGVCLFDQQGDVNTSGCLHDTYGTDSSPLVAPLVCLANSSTSTISMTKAIESTASTSTLGEPVVKSNPLQTFTIIKTPNSRTMNQQEISQLKSSSVHKTVGDGKRINKKKEDKQQWPQLHEDEDEQIVDEKKKLINLSEAFSNLKSDMFTSDYSSGNKQAEHQCLSSESKQSNYSSGDISNV
ncbi:unnamed protein product [Schistosoma intercalatum]|nr:unnamed protein product [Schistosoma intercalatum]